MSQLKCSDVSLGYEGRTIIKHLNFEVNAGDYLCIVGSNGSGKSTLAKLLNGILEADGGTLVVAGKELTSPELTASRCPSGKSTTSAPSPSMSTAMP